jgi:HK97 family phage portal protein
MGLYSKYLKPQLTAAIAPYTFPDKPLSVWSPGFDGVSSTFVTRREALSVPACSRGRNVIVGTAASLELHVKRKFDDSRVEPTPTIISQPDKNMPTAVVYGMTAENLLFHGVAYWQIKEIDPATGRPSQIRWIDAPRVSQVLDSTGEIVIGYQLEAQRLPDNGIGSLIQFTGIDPDGILNRGGRTLRTAAALERAVFNYAETPTPSVVLKANVPMDSNKATAILNAWKQARQTKGTAFLSDNVDMQSVGFNAADLQLTEAREYLAKEIARLMNIPAYYLDAATNSMTYSNVTAERRALLDFSLRPLLTAIEQRLSMDDVTVSTQYVEYDLDDFLRGNPLERADVYSKLIPLGVLTVDEAREEEDLVR